MHFPKHSTALSIIVALHSAALAATPSAGLQEPGLPSETSAPAFIAPSAADLQRLFFDQPGDGRIWARGATFKASFGVEGATYIPFLGSAAPQNYPVRFTIAALESGGVPIDFDAEAHAKLDGQTVHYDRGSVIESYLLATSSIEQVFTLRDLPARGEIVLRLDLHSELEPVRDGANVRLRNALGHVAYDNALAFDARGETVLLESELVDGAIQLRVPAEFVASARLPLSIDPLISTFAIDTSTAQTFSPNVAYDATSDRYLVAYRVAVSGGDHDIFARMYTGAGVLLPAMDAFVDQTSESWSRPGVANNNFMNQFMMASGVTNSTSVRRVVARTRSASTGALSLTIAVHSTTEGNCNTLSVGGDNSDVDLRPYCIAWRQGTDQSFARLVTTTGSLVGVAPLALVGPSSTSNAKPAVSKSCNASAWNVVWEADQGALGVNVVGRRIRTDGTFAGPAFSITTDGGSTNPQVSSCLSGTNRYAVVYENLTGSGTNIGMYVVDDATSLAFKTVSRNLDNSFLYGASLPSAATDGKHFLVAYSALQPGSTTNKNVYVSDWFLTPTNEIDNAILRVTLAGSGTPEQDVLVTSRFDGSGATTGSAWNRSMLVWDDNDDNIEGALFETLIGGPVSKFCFGDGTSNDCPCANTSAQRGCPNSLDPLGAELWHTGAASLSQDSLRLYVDYGVGSWAFFYQGTARLSSGGLYGVPFGDGLNCTGGVIVRFAAAPMSSGHASLGSTVNPIHTLGNVLSAGTRYYQAWYRNSADFCVSAVTNTTNAVQAVWTP